MLPEYLPDIRPVGHVFVADAAACSSSACLGHCGSEVFIELLKSWLKRWGDLGELLVHEAIGTVESDLAVWLEPELAYIAAFGARVDFPFDRLTNFPSSWRVAMDRTDVMISVNVPEKAKL